MEAKFWVLDNTFRFTLEKCSKLRQPVFSPDNFWRIWVGPDDKKLYLRFCIKCKPQLVPDGWVCEAIVVVRIINKFVGKPGFKKIGQGKINKKTWLDFGKLLSWKSIMDPTKGFIENDELVFEVHVISNYKSLTETDNYTKNLIRISQINIDKLENLLQENVILLQETETSKEATVKELEDLKIKFNLLTENNKLLKASIEDKENIIASLECRLMSANKPNELKNCISDFENKTSQLIAEKNSIINSKAKVERECEVLEEELGVTKNINEALIMQLKKSQEDSENILKNSCIMSKNLKEYDQVMLNIKQEIECLLESNYEEKSYIFNKLQDILKMSVDDFDIATKNFLFEDIGNLQKHLQFILKVEEDEKFAKEKTITKLQKKVKELLSELEDKDIVLRKYERKSENIDSFIQALRKKLEDTQIDFPSMWSSFIDKVPSE